MKKIYTLLAFAAILSVAGCKKADVSVQTPDDETDGRVPVLFSLGQPSYDVSVKSVGGVDAWDGHELYIFGYPTDAPDFTETNALIYNVSATTTDLADPDDNGYGTSQPLTVEHTVGTGSEPFYYSADNITYDFYGYHIDDAAGDTPDPLVITAAGAQSDGTELAEGVYIPFTINGAQDLMTATADKTVDIGKASPEGSVSESQAYSAYAARRNVQPNLLFQHRLTRFSFEIKSGSLAGNNVNVESVSLLSPVKGYLCVVGESNPITIAADDTPTDLLLMGRADDGTSTALDPVKPNAYTDPDTEVTPKEIGESIMVIPGQSEYRLTIQTSMEGSQTDVPAQTYTLTPGSVTGDVTKFEAGKEYKVTITIYGLEEVKVTATLVKWEDGGNIELDPDEWTEPTDSPEPEPEPEPGTDENPETPEPQP